MKEIITGKGEFIFIEKKFGIYSTYEKFLVIGSSIDDVLSKVNKIRNGDTKGFFCFDKPIEIIATTKDITEEQVIEHFTGQSFLYSLDEPDALECQLYSCDDDEETLSNTAKKSLQLLIEASGLDETKNYLILKNQNHEKTII